MTVLTAPPLTGTVDPALLGAGRLPVAPAGTRWELGDGPEPYTASARRARELRLVEVHRSSPCRWRRLLRRDVVVGRRALPPTAQLTAARLQAAAYALLAAAGYPTGPQPREAAAAPAVRRVRPRSRHRTGHCSYEQRATTSPCRRRRRPG